MRVFDCGNKIHNKCSTYFIVDYNSRYYTLQFVQCTCLLMCNVHTYTYVNLITDAKYDILEISF
jgi:hypothetical protein